MWNSSSGGWYTYPSEKFDFVSWDDEIPNVWKNEKHVPNHQLVIAMFDYRRECCFQVSTAIEAWSVVDGFTKVSSKQPILNQQSHHLSSVFGSGETSEHVR
jgi:hypothetical protein